MSNKLTNGKAWATYAGGCFAASGSNSYDVRTSIGSYKINPVSSKTNVERHLGYMVWFVNDLGKVNGGLWQQLRLVNIGQGVYNLRESRAICQKHLDEHEGEVLDQSQYIGYSDDVELANAIWKKVRDCRIWPDTAALEKLATQYFPNQDSFIMKSAVLRIWQHAQALKDAENAHRSDPESNKKRKSMSKLYNGPINGGMI